MKKKIIYFITILLLTVYLVINTAVGDKTSSLQDLKNKISPEIKNFLKETIFVYKNQKILKNQLVQKNKLIEQLTDTNVNLSRQVIGMGKIAFKKISNNEYFINSNSIVLNKFNTKVFNYLGKHEGAIGSSYLEIDGKNLLLGSGNGDFAFMEINSFNRNEFNAQSIKSNFKEIVTYPKFYKSGFYGGVKDIFLLNDQLYVSYTNKIQKDCYNISILRANLSYEFLKFENFFDPKICIKEENDYGEYNGHQEGGRIVEYVDNKILFTVGEFRYRDYAQNKDIVFGKIVSIDLDTAVYEVISMGHRNPQGLKYLKEENIIVNSEHGPIGGDELNVNFDPENEIENFGWPISSYGEHFGFKKRDDNHKLYKKAPYYDSHEKYGFIEPVKYWKPSIGTSEIIILKPNTFTVNSNREILVAAMGNKVKEGDLAIHYLQADNEFKIKKHEIITIKERIRDMIYSDKLGKIFLFLESTSSIGVIDLK